MLIFIKEMITYKISNNKILTINNPMYKRINHPKHLRTPVTNLKRSIQCFKISNLLQKI